MGLMSKIFLLVMISYLKFDGTKTSRRMMSENPTTRALLSLITPSMRSTPFNIETSSFKSIRMTTTPGITSSEQSIRGEVSSKLLFDKNNQKTEASAHSITTSSPITVDDTNQFTAISEKMHTSSTFPSDLSSLNKETSGVFPTTSTSGISPSAHEQNETVYEEFLSNIQQMTHVACSSGECSSLDLSSTTTPDNNANDQRNFMCKMHPDIQDCYEQVNQTEAFVCLDAIYSCQGRCGQIMNSCSCDMHCRLYNVCCDDFEDVCPQLWSEGEHKLGNLLNTRIECAGGLVKYLVIAGCSMNDYSEDDRDNCVNGDTMITSAGALYFKNIFCMKCNGIDEAESEKWDFFLRVGLERDVSIMFYSSIDSSDKEGFLSKSVTEWKDSQQMSKTSRVCSNRIIGECPPGATTWIKDKCLSGKADVYVETRGGSNLYKNRYCADCNVDSDYYCRRTKRGDYADNLKQRFSSLINVTLDKNTDKFVLEASAPFRWRRAECFGRLADLNCQITKCFIDITPTDNACVVESTINCVLIKFSLITEPTFDSDCHSNSTCISEAFDTLIATMLRTGPGIRGDMKSVTNKREIDVANLSFESHLLFTVWSGSFSFSLDYIYEAYKPTANNVLYEHGFRGKFTLCFAVFKDTHTCLDVECNPRTYIIHSPTDPDVTDAAKSFGCPIHFSLSGLLFSIFCLIFLSPELINSKYE